MPPAHAPCPSQVHLGDAEREKVEAEKKQQAAALAAIAEQKQRQLAEQRKAAEEEARKRQLAELAKRGAEQLQAAKERWKTNEAMAKVGGRGDGGRRGCELCSTGL